MGWEGALTEAGGKASVKTVLNIEGVIHWVKCF